MHADTPALEAMQSAARGLSQDFEDHQGAMHKIAKTGFAMLQEAGCSATYDDVFQVVSEGYCKALKSFDPTRGFQFNTYFFHACRNTMMRWAGVQIREKAALGHFQFPASPDPEDSDVEYATNSVFELQDHNCPGQRLERAQEARENIARLSTNSRLVIGELMNPGAVTAQAEQTFGREPKVRDLCAVIGMNEKQIKLCRAELKRVFGVAV